MDVEIKNYEKRYEKEWVKCHMLVDLKGDAGELLKEKPKYTGKAIELIATIDDRIVGFLDVEAENYPRQICYKKVRGNGMLWDVGVLQEYRGHGIGSKLLIEGLAHAKTILRLRRIEAWTVEETAKQFYEKHGFKKFYEYHHIRCEKRKKLKEFDKDGLHVISLYAHVMPDTSLEEVVKRYEPKEVFTCSGYEISLTVQGVKQASSELLSKNKKHKRSVKAQVG